MQPGVSEVGLQVVRKNPQSSFNTNCRFTALEDCVPYNLAMLPNDLSDEHCTEFSVVDPEGLLGEH